MCCNALPLAGQRRLTLPEGSVNTACYRVRRKSCARKCRGRHNAHFYILYKNCYFLIWALYTFPNTDPAAFMVATGTARRLFDPEVFFRRCVSAAAVLHRLKSAHKNIDIIALVSLRIRTKKCQNKNWQTQCIVWIQYARMHANSVDMRSPLPRGRTACCRKCCDILLIFDRSCIFLLVGWFIKRVMLFTYSYEYYSSYPKRILPSSHPRRHLVAPPTP